MAYLAPFLDPARWQFVDLPPRSADPTGPDFSVGAPSGDLALSASRREQTGNTERVSTAAIDLSVSDTTATSAARSVSSLRQIEPGAAPDSAAAQPGRAAPAEDKGGPPALEAGAADEPPAADGPNVQTIELALVVDASVFAGRAWLHAPEGGDGPVTVLEAEVAAYTHLLTDLALRVRDAERRDPALEVKLEGIAVIHADSGAPHEILFDFDAIDADTTDAEIGAILADEVLDALAGTRPGGQQLWAPAIEAAAAFFSDSSVGGDDPDGVDRFLFQITDSARGRLSRSAIDAVEAVDGLVRDVWLAPHDRRVWDSGPSGLGALDSTGDGPETLSATDSLVLPDLDFL